MKDPIKSIRLIKHIPFGPTKGSVFNPSGPKTFNQSKGICKMYINDEGTHFKTSFVVDFDFLVSDYFEEVPLNFEILTVHGNRITSIKRLSDGETFSNGDFVEHTYNSKRNTIAPALIDGFRVIEDNRSNLMVLGKDGYQLWGFSGLFKSEESLTSNNRIV